MGLGKIYRNYLKNNLFMRLLLLFSLITIITIITFSYFMYRSMSQAAINRELDMQKKAMENVYTYLGDKHESAQSILLGIYRDSSLAAGVSFMLQHPFQEYVQHSLEQYNLKSFTNGKFLRRLMRSLRKSSGIWFTSHIEKPSGQVVWYR